MLNYIWSVMMIVGILWAALHGNLEAVTEAALDSAREAVTLGISMLGIMAFWSGILEIGNGAGLIGLLSEKMKPVLRFLFPRLPDSHPAMKQIAVNMIANILGLGWAATPAGLKAMEELKELEEERRKKGGDAFAPDTASNEMCTFLIVNISSLQLIPITMIAYRSQYGSVDPAAITGPSLIATAASTAAAVVFCEVMDRKQKRKIL